MAGTLQAPLLHGYAIPPSRPDARLNRFIDFYSNDGLTFRVENAAAMSRLQAEILRFQSVVNWDRAVPLALWPLLYPRLIPLNIAWAVGAPAGVGLHAGIIRAITFHLLGPGHARLPDDYLEIPICEFSRLCAGPSTLATAPPAWVEERLHRQAPIIAPFAMPLINVNWFCTKTWSVLGSGQDIQRWRCWQCCTNCIAAGCLGSCSHFIAAENLVDFAGHVRSPQQFMKYEIVPQGERSSMDRQWPDSLTSIVMIEQVDVSLPPLDERWGNEPRGLPPGSVERRVADGV